MTVTQETLDKLGEYDTPTICNVIELFDIRPRNTGYMDHRIRCNFPEMAPFVGFACTAQFRSDAPPVEGAAEKAIAEPQPDAGEVATERLWLGRQVGELQRMLRRLLSRKADDTLSDLPAELREIQLHLLGQDVPAETATELIGQLKLALTGRQLCDRRLLRARTHDLICERIPTVPNAVGRTSTDRPRVIALIGPTGVGKTTTVAKLAAAYKLQEKMRVGLITIDTYRIAAVDQLRTYAEIIKVPLQAVLSAGQLYKTIRRMRDLDVVLIDTAGRSQNNQMRLSELRGFLVAASADEIHLAISATSNRACAKATVKRFGPLGANRILLTKVDEAATFGVVLDVVSAGNLGLSYVTTGQNVPDDIAPADARILADWIVEGSVYGD